MIAQLTGTVAAAGLGAVVLDVGGVGYRVLVPPATPIGSVGARVTLYTHLAVREDALTLYGFRDLASREVFETLLGVSGVGPKLALAAIGTLGADRLRQAVAGEDVAALCVVPGVGKKGAQRMILELRGRLTGDGDAVTAAAGGDDPRAQVREALAGLGYGAAEVQRAMDALPAGADGAPEELLREALRTLSR